MKSFQHINCRTLGEATDLLRRYARRAVVSAGGTDLLGTLKDCIHPDYPEMVVHVKTIGGLDYIREEEGTLAVGAMVRLSDLARNPLVTEGYPALAQAARSVATPQIRNMATLGGNLCQEPRCWYYRHPDNLYHCFRKGGETCPARIGENRYHSVFGPVRRTPPPCSIHCPAGTDTADYLEALRSGDTAGAARILLRKNPFPAVTGRVCPRYCRDACSRREIDRAVSIREIEADLGDYILDHAEDFYLPPEVETDWTAAVIGAGPAGLAAAYALRRAGFSVTVYDKMEKAGGMLRYSLPDYRLPEDVVDRTVSALEGMGILFRCGAGIDREGLGELRRRCDAVYVATGAWKSLRLDLEGCRPALDFLKQARRGNREPADRRVVVIGGGNVAVDAAVTARRLGAEQVTLVCLEDRASMPAEEEEIAEAEAEGVRIIPGRGPEGITETPEGEKVLHLVRCASVFDEDGRFAPRYDRQDRETLPFDAVYAAVGQRPDTSFLPEDVLDEAGRFNADYDTGRTPVPGVYGGGDLLKPANVIDAAAAGMRAAESIMADLGLKESPGDNGGSLPRFLTFDPEALIPAGTESDPAHCLNCGCVAVNPSDTGAVLAALKAEIQTTERAIPAELFFDCPEGSSTVLRPGELVTEVRLPKPPPGTRTVYLKYRERRAIDFPVVGAAVRLQVENGIIRDVAFVLGAAAPFPVRARRAEEFLIGKSLEEAEESLSDHGIDGLPGSKAASLAVEGMVSLPENAYKIRLFRAYVRRALVLCLKA